MISNDVLRKKVLDGLKREFDFMVDVDKRLSNIIITVSTGAFAVSIAFLTGWKDPLSDLPRIFLALSWGFLAFTILLETINYFLSRKASSNFYDKLQSRVEERTDLTDLNFIELLKEDRSSCVRKAIHKINIFVMIMFVVSVALLATFAITSLYP